MKRYHHFRVSYCPGYSLALLGAVQKCQPKHTKRKRIGLRCVSLHCCASEKPPGKSSVSMRFRSPCSSAPSVDHDRVRPAESHSFARRSPGPNRCFQYTSEIHAMLFMEGLSLTTWAPQVNRCVPKATCIPRDWCSHSCVWSAVSGGLRAQRVVWLCTFCVYLGVCEVVLSANSYFYMSGQTLCG